jgi:hypothetical protein
MASELVSKRDQMSTTCILRSHFSACYCQQIYKNLRHTDYVCVGKKKGALTRNNLSCILLNVCISITDTWRASGFHPAVDQLKHRRPYKSGFQTLKKGGCRPMGQVLASGVFASILTQFRVSVTVGECATFCRRRTSRPVETGISS